MLGILLASQVHKVQLDSKDGRTSSFKMLGLVRIAFNLRNALHREVLGSPAKIHETLREGYTHHVLKCDVDVIALRAKQLSRP